MHAAAAQLNHPLTQAAQARQVKLGVTVGAARTLGLGRCQHAVGANHIAAGLVSHQKVLAVVVKQINIMAGHCYG